MAVGTNRALDSAIGLPKRSTNAWWMLVLLMPAEVRRSFMNFIANILTLYPTSALNSTKKSSSPAHLLNSIQRERLLSFSLGSEHGCFASIDQEMTQERQK